MKWWWNILLMGAFVACQPSSEAEMNRYEEPGVST